MNQPKKNTSNPNSLSAKAIKRKKNLIKKRLLFFSICFVLLLLCFSILFSRKQVPKDTFTFSSLEENKVNSNFTQNNKSDSSTKITDWRLTLANIDHPLPENFSVELANIDKNRQFDKRAIDDLNAMMKAARNSGISNFWIQSSFRSVTKQKELYENSIQKYLKQGKTEQEAERLTLLFLNKPGCSDHNLGLAVDFNYVENSFAKSKAFSWLQQNASDYGFILRYPKEKESITKISYESWHWRYVGQEHAKKMNELNMCLEEYIEFLQT